MSHFIGLVFLRPDADLDETLAPFNEQDETFMEFVDKTDEVKERWDKLPETCPSEGTFTEEIDRTDLINGIWDEAADTLSPEDENAFWKPYTKDKYRTPADIARDKKYEVVPDETKRDGVRFVQRYESEWKYEPSREKYPTIDKLAKEYFGYRKVRGKYGYMSNPNAKWDWYSEGGRWSGYLTNKEGKTTECEMLTEVDLTQPVALAVGAEQFGLSELWMSQADIKVRLPMMGAADSLNVATATTIVLYEVLRQRIAAGMLTVPPPAPDNEVRAGSPQR